MFLRDGISFRNANYIDLINENFSKKDKHIIQSINVWGSGNHKHNRKN